jgi:hypothetical protein
VYGPTGSSNALPSDEYSLVGRGQDKYHAPIAMELETVALPLNNPLAGVSSGITRFGAGTFLTTRLSHRKMAGDMVWIESVRIHSTLPKARLQHLNDLGSYAVLAAKSGTDFYRLVIVERTAATGQEVGAAVFLSRSISPEAMVSMMNSLPGVGTAGTSAPTSANPNSKS